MPRPLSGSNLLICKGKILRISSLLTAHTRHEVSVRRCQAGRFADCRVCTHVGGTAQCQTCSVVPAVSRGRSEASNKRPDGGVQTLASGRDQSKGGGGLKRSPLSFHLPHPFLLVTAAWTCAEPFTQVISFRACEVGAVIVILQLRKQAGRGDVIHPRLASGARDLLKLRSLGHHLPCEVLQPVAEPFALWEERTVPCGAGRPREIGSPSPRSFPRPPSAAPGTCCLWN